LPLETIRPFASDGSPGLLRIGFGIGRSDDRYEPLRARFLTLYERNLARETKLFPEMGDVIDTLDARAIPWGIVTNKLSYLAEPLLEALRLASRAACIVCGDSAARIKPWPDPLLLAAERLRTKPAACLYLGDNARDVQAGQRAGMRTLVALFGYLHPHDDPMRWRADGYLNRPSELLDWL
jgi:phosphoglycolate phosphatase